MGLGFKYTRLSGSVKLRWALTSGSPEGGLGLLPPSCGLRPDAFGALLLSLDLSLSRRFCLGFKGRLGLANLG